MYIYIFLYSTIHIIFSLLKLSKRGKKKAFLKLIKNSPRVWKIKWKTIVPRTQKKLKLKGSKPYFIPENLHHFSITLKSSYVSSLQPKLDHRQQCMDPCNLYLFSFPQRVKFLPGNRYTISWNYHLSPFLNTTSYTNLKQ